MTELKKRLTIGLQVPALDNIYIRLILKGVHSALSRMDANLIIFPGETPNNPWMKMHHQEAVIYDLISPKNVDALILPSAVFSNFCADGEFQTWLDKFSQLPIVSLGTDLTDIVDTQSSILIDNNSGLEALIEHVIHEHNYKKIAYLGGSKDNQDAIERLETFKNTLTKHNIPISEDYIFYGHFAYSDGKDCIKAFFDERNIQPEIIICANDSSAFGVMDELHKRGLRIPKDIAVTGFDNAKEAEYYIPPLSTVSQPLFELGLKAAEIAVKMANNKKVEKSYKLETHFINRQSCGCQQIDFSSSKTHNHEHIPNNEKNQLFVNILERINYDQLTNNNVSNLITDIITLFKSGFENISTDKHAKDIRSILLQNFNERFQKDVKSGESFEVWRTYFKKLEKHILTSNLSKVEVLFFFQLKDTFSQSLICHLESHSIFNDRAYFFRNFLRIIFDARTLEQLSEVLASELENLGIKSFYLTCFDTPIFHDHKKKWYAPQSAQLTNAFDAGNYNQFSKSLPQYDTAQLLPDHYLPTDRRFSLVVESLYLSGDQLGRICYEWSINDTEMLTNLMLNGQISTAIKNIHMYYEQNRIQKTVNNLMNNLTHMNTQLENQSKSDELTVLLNRRGFLEKSEMLLNQAKELEFNCKLMFLDLDGLKAINDNFGHHKGDLAIIEFANILNTVFRQNDAIARFGGDEFVVLAANVSDELMLKKIAMIQHRIDHFNVENEDSWMLSASMGYVNAGYKDDQPLSHLLTQADQILYEQKRKKKKYSKDTIQHSTGLLFNPNHSNNKNARI
ncbi:GGDEF domain-containing protein [Marinicellulosiphila megalodicopiae]|uniref:substrate-binding and GGDEF domain-containing protein n=1 Tax=Marinicellulosiphila megalodicopiae TaxID=2724896 RepID=UPI003BB0FCD7